MRKEIDELREKGVVTCTIRFEMEFMMNKRVELKKNEWNNAVVWVLIRYASNLNFLIFFAEDKRITCYITC